MAFPTCRATATVSRNCGRTMSMQSSGGSTWMVQYSLAGPTVRSSSSTTFGITGRTDLAASNSSARSRSSVVRRPCRYSLDVLAKGFTADLCVQFRLEISVIGVVASGGGPRGGIGHLDLHPIGWQDFLCRDFEVVEDSTLFAQF